ncbi:branched-chain amino acid ABC transporter permease [Caballeronia sp. S22]|uniref:branched-chain amino acid ABC transporter permease n=1 Tax=Caballeronia sp. S22 TaxID=3137182 RepID=UPI00353122FD
MNVGEGLVLLESLLQATCAGLLVGGVYALMCLGLGMIFSVMRVVNFAQGEFLMLGMYGTFYICSSFALDSVLGPLVAPIVAAGIAGLVLFGVGMAVQAWLLNRVTGLKTMGVPGDGHFPQLIVTLGLALVISNGALMAFGSSPQGLHTPYSSRAWEIGPLVGQDVSVFVNKARAASLCVALIVAGLLYCFVKRSSTGRTLRAAADNPVAAVYVGVDVQRSFRIAFGLGCAVTGIAGGLLATYLPFQPYVGTDFVTVMYAGVVLGGLGSIAGSFFGGLIIGLVQQLSGLVLPAQLQNAAIFVIFLLVVLLRPQGLLGRNVERT